MPNLYIIRHGETDYNKFEKYLGRTNIPLNSLGITQAKRLANKLKNLNIKIIYCSPLKRTAETAGFLRAKHDCEFIVDNHFIERSVGVYEGLTKFEAKKKYPELYARNITRIFDDAPPNGETINQVIKRVFSGLDNIRKENKYSDIMIVTHGFIVKVINKYFYPEITEQEFFNFNLSNASIKKYTLE